MRHPPLRPLLWAVLCAAFGTGSAWAATPAADAEAWAHRPVKDAVTQWATFDKGKVQQLVDGMTDRRWLLGMLQEANTLTETTRCTIAHRLLELGDLSHEAERDIADCLGPSVLKNRLYPYSTREAMALALDELHPENAPENLLALLKSVREDNTQALRTALGGQAFTRADAASLLLIIKDATIAFALRQKALEKLPTDEAQLLGLVRSNIDAHLRKMVGTRLAQLPTLDPSTILLCVRLVDDKALSVNDVVEIIGRTDDQRLLEQVAVACGQDAVFEAALAKIDSQPVLIDLFMESHKSRREAVYTKITDHEVLIARLADTLESDGYMKTPFESTELSECPSEIAVLAVLKWGAEVKARQAPAALACRDFAAEHAAALSPASKVRIRTLIDEVRAAALLRSHAATKENLVLKGLYIGMPREDFLLLDVACVTATCTDGRVSELIWTEQGSVRFFGMEPDEFEERFPKRLDIPAFKSDFDWDDGFFKYTESHKWGVRFILKRDGTLMMKALQDKHHKKE